MRILVDSQLGVRELAALEASCWQPGGRNRKHRLQSARTLPAQGGAGCGPLYRSAHACSARISALYQSLTLPSPGDLRKPASSYAGEGATGNPAFARSD